MQKLQQYGARLLGTEVPVFRNVHEFSTDIDISSDSFWFDHDFDEREVSFKRLRNESPVSWHPPLAVPFPHEEAGFWAVTRAADITQVSMDSTRFQSKYGVGFGATPPFEIPEASFFLAMDPPEHGRYRGLISAAFTPKAIRAIAERIETRARDIVDSLVGAGDFDFVQTCSSRLPMATVSDIVGVPPSLQEQVALAAENMVGSANAAKVPPDQRLAYTIEQIQFLYRVGADLAAHRRANPGDDLMTNLVQTEIDGLQLTDGDIGEFMVLMAIAGNDTTKQTTTRTALSLQEHPDQRAWLMEDFEGRIMQSVEEFVRHASPVMDFARTASVDTTIAGVEISAGDKVMMFYCSGNRDEAVWNDPATFDLTRERRRHVGFGGGGAHFCLGNGVAKTQLRALFKELLTKLPGLELGEPVRLRSTFINGIESLPAQVA